MQPSDQSRGASDQSRDCRHYYGASKEMRLETGQPWFVEGCAWTSPGNFAEAFQSRLTRRLNWEAQQANLAPPDSSGEQVGWHYTPSPGGDFAASQQHELPPCSEQSATLRPCSLKPAGIYIRQYFNCSNHSNSSPAVSFPFPRNALQSAAGYCFDLTGRLP